MRIRYESLGGVGYVYFLFRRFVNHDEVVVVPVYYARKMHLLYKVFQRRFNGYGAKSYFFRRIAYVIKRDSFSGYAAQVS